MRLNLPAIALIGLSVFISISASATSIVPFVHLGEATLYSECVVLARAVETIETTENGTVFKDTKFESIELTKGVLNPGTIFSLRPYARRHKGFNIEISGDFKPEIGKTYLLFLYQNGDFWRPVMLFYYAFEQFKESDDEFLVPIGGEGLERIPRPDGQIAEPLDVYSKQILLQQLQAYSIAPQSGWDGALGRSALPASYFTAQDRAVPAGCDFTLGGPDLCRWQNAAIPIYYDDTNNPVGWGGTFATILGALNDNYTGIDPSDAGSKTYVPNCGNGSAIEGNFTNFCDSDLNGPQSALIIFDDPCNEIQDLNNCVGTLAFGGSYSSSTTHQFDGLNWDDALYGFVVVNNGTPGCLGQVQFEQMLTHELTHVHRMGHLNPAGFPGQNMNPNCCNPINHKDRECMNYAYPPPAPVELLSFNAQLMGEQKVKHFRWATASEKDNAYFSIQRSGNGLQYEMIQEVESTGSTAGGAYEWLDTRPLAGINYYWLSQTDFDGTIQHLGVKAVTIGKSNTLNVSPNPVKSGILAFDLDLPGYFDGSMEVLTTDGEVVYSKNLLFEKGVQQWQQAISEIPAGVYLLRLSDGQQQWFARFLKQ